MATPPWATLNTQRPAPALPPGAMAPVPPPPRPRSPQPPPPPPPRPPIHHANGDAPPSLPPKIPAPRPISPIPPFPKSESFEDFGPKSTGSHASPPSLPPSVGRRPLPRPPTSPPITPIIGDSRSPRGLPTVPQPLLATPPGISPNGRPAPIHVPSPPQPPDRIQTLRTQASLDSWDDSPPSSSEAGPSRYTSASSTMYETSLSSHLSGTGISSEDSHYSDKLELPHEIIDGRGTPTQQNWMASLPPAQPQLDSSPTTPTSRRGPSLNTPPMPGEDFGLNFPVPRAAPPAGTLPHREPSVTSITTTTDSDRRRSSILSPSWAEQSQAPSQWVERKLQIHESHREDDASYQEYEDEVDDDPWDDDEEAEVNEIRFFQPAFLSEAALQLRDRVERRRHTKAGIAWVGSFTGKDIVTTIQSFLPAFTRASLSDRRFALVTAQSLQNQLWFVEVDWDIKPLRDSSDDVFRFMGEMEGMSSGDALDSELPKGVMTMATRCYSPSCPGDSRCYAPHCPYKVAPDSFISVSQVQPAPAVASTSRTDWTDDVDPLLLREISPQQHNRQTIIRKAIESEIQFEADLTAMETYYIEGLRNADIIHPPRRLEPFIAEVFGNALDLREACRRLIDNFSIRQREQAPLINTVGDIFLEAATDFRLVYPTYTGRLPQAEIALKRELDENLEFRMYAEKVVRETDRRMDVRHLISRPQAQLQRYPAVLEALLHATDYEDPDHDFLAEALSSIQNLSLISQLKLFHASKGRGPAGKMQWYDLVPDDQRALIEKKEQKRQMQIWELIQGEMEYVADLETLDELFVNGLRESDVPIIDRNRLEIFLDDGFHNYRSILEVHQQLLENLQNRQAEQHPNFGVISDLVLDAALNWQDAYMEYVTHYPIAKAKVQEEQNRNSKFAAFLEICLKDPSASRQDIYHFINRPIPRLLRYNLLLTDILKSLKEVGPPNHPDIETIPQVIELIGDLAKATQKGVAVNEAKVELWQFQHSLDGSKFGTRAVKDLDLLNPMRELIHKGKVYRQPEGTISTGWTELTVFLFDNYLVLVKTERHTRSSRREERQLRYLINRRPIPLELLSLGSFTDPPRSRPTGRLFGVGGGTTHEQEVQETTSDSRTVYPFTISFIGQGQLGGQYTLWTDSTSARSEWQEKLQHAKVLRAEVNDAGKVFEMTPLSLDTFYMAPNYAQPKTDGDSPYTGRVTCSSPFITPDGRSLVAVGCEEGVWIGLRHDPSSLRKVLHVKAVTNIAVLEEFGIFLVLQDKSLLAYHLEALVPSASSPQVRAAPQRLSPGKDIVFFTVGQLYGRTLVLYMKKKGMDSLFRVLEPILGRNVEDNRQRRPFGNFLGQRTEWFRLYKDFFIPTEALNVHFLKHKLAVVCSKGFEIMDLTDLKGGSIPIFDPAKTRDRLSLAELQKRCDTARPLGMFRSTETEFLLCYDSFGMYVDRHGEPNRDCQAIEWEGRPESVAFHPPYLLLVSAPFIEIRHIDTAKLVQIQTGSDVRLTWDGTGGQVKPFVDNPGPNGYGDEVSSQEPRIHLCQRPDDRRQRGPHGIGQHVFELTPTLLLNNPLLNPVHTHDANYFPPAPMLSHRPSSIMTTSTDLNSTPYYSTYSGPDREPSWNGNGHPQY